MRRDCWSNSDGLESKAPDLYQEKRDSLSDSWKKDPSRLDVFLHTSEGVSWRLLLCCLPFPVFILYSLPFNMFVTNLPYNWR